MEPFSTLHSTAVLIPYDDIDTDQIIPAKYLKITDKAGLADGLFTGWRYLADGGVNPEFPLNCPELRASRILIAGNNFGCGSSREHAPWALNGWGFRVVISTSFADIFRSNALKNGLLPLRIDPSFHRRLVDHLTIDPLAYLIVNLDSQTLTLPDGECTSFPIDPFHKNCLLLGLDTLGYLLKFSSQITAFETASATNE